ncbi:MAG: hypothetical protein QM500_06230, partial [Methylococcales bacterium]
AIYTVEYDVIDNDGNSAIQVIRNISIGAFATGSNFSMLDPTGKTFGGTNDVVFNWNGEFNTDESDIDFGTNMTIASALPQRFFSYIWTAHHIRVYGPGTYTFDTTCSAADFDAGLTTCNNPAPVIPGAQSTISMTVPAGQIGAHIIFDWGKPNDANTGTTSCGVANCDIDVVNVWKQDDLWEDLDGDASAKNNLFSGSAGSAPDPTKPWKLVSTDHNADSVNGSPMVDGPFIGFYANFNAGPGGTTVVLPITTETKDTKLGSGSVGIGTLLVSLFSLLGFGLRRKR